MFQCFSLPQNPKTPKPLFSSNASKQNKINLK